MLKIYKKMGETPLECLKRLRQDNPKYENVKMTYAGRLDPMAEGELLVLFGDECQEKDKYLGLDKVYEFEVLFGFQTDTYDILGLVDNFEKREDYDVARHQERLRRFLADHLGKQQQVYPPFSAKTMAGKPLFELAKTKRLDANKLPCREIEIYEADLLRNYWLTGQTLKADVLKRILLVKGDFRQTEILERWEKVLKKERENRFLLSQIRIKCSGGTYVRSLVNSLSEKLSYPVLTFKIKRTQIFI